MKPRKSSIYADFRVSEGLHNGPYEKLAAGRDGVGRAVRDIRAVSLLRLVGTLPCEGWRVPDFAVPACPHKQRTMLVTRGGGSSDAET